MYFLYQTGTNLFFYGCLYFFQILLFIICRVLNVDTELTNKIVLFSFTGMLMLLCSAIAISHCIKDRQLLRQKVFHPSFSKRQKIATACCIVSLIINIGLCFLAVCFSNISSMCFIITNVLSISILIFSIIISLFMEALPDKNDTIIFTEDAICYYMRVNKVSKFNKHMNSYIIPYDCITRSYIHKKIWYIEYDRNHPDLKIRREFSTKSMRISIDLIYYPSIKKLLSTKEIIQKAKIKKFENITNSNYI